jgi:hypothetical protein
MKICLPCIAFLTSCVYRTPSKSWNRYGVWVWRSLSLVFGEYHSRFWSCVVFNSVFLSLIFFLNLQFSLRCNFSFDIDLFKLDLLQFHENSCFVVLTQFNQLNWVFEISAEQVSVKFSQLPNYITQCAKNFRVYVTFSNMTVKKNHPQISNFDQRYFV